MTTANTQIASIKLEDTDYPLLTPTYINQEIVEKNGNFITFNRLAQLKTALDALQPTPPNNTTVWFDNTLLLDTASSPSITYNTINTTSMTLTDPNSIATTTNSTFSIIDQAIYGTRQLNLDAGSLTINDGVGSTSYMDAGSLTLTSGTNTTSINSNTIQASADLHITNTGNSGNMYINCDNALNLTTNSGNMDISTGSGADIGFSVGYDFSVSLQIPDRYISLNGTNIALNGTNITSDLGGGGNYILPCQLTNKYTGGYAYTNAGSWEMVRSYDMYIPIPQLTSGYTTWKMDFAINCWNMTNQDDKAYAMYIEIRDVNGGGSDYQGFLFNQTTPYTTHKNSSSYGATTSQIENYCYTDYIDLTGAYGSPLEIRLWRYADNTMTCDFSWLLTLSKTNIV
jgi:hypothetical protein